MGAKKKVVSGDARQRWNRSFRKRLNAYQRGAKRRRDVFDPLKYGRPIHARKETG